MKPQDILFLIIFLSVLYTRNPKYMAILGIVCLILAIPLFFLWIFFTAEHLTWYAVFCFLVAAILYGKKRE